MSNPFDQVRQAVIDARTQLRAADSVAGSMASLLRGRLRNVDDRYVLAALKRELRDFNLTTKTWKDR